MISHLSALTISRILILKFVVFLGMGSLMDSLNSSNTTLIPEVENVAYVGVPRHGKTEACIARNAPLMTKPDRDAFVVFDPPGSMTKKIATSLAIHDIPFMYDAVNETSNNPGYTFCSRSANPDSDQQEAENRETISDVIAVLVRAEGKMTATKNQMIQRGLTDALLLHIYQDTPSPFDLLQHCFIGESEQSQYLMAHCTNPEVFLRFLYYHSLKGQQRAFEVGPAERRLMTVCSCPQFRRRCRETFDLAAFLNGGGILLMDGSSKGNLSREDAALVQGMVLLRVIALARSGKLTRRVVLIIDEGLNAGLIDGNVALALKEASKWGLIFHILMQTPETSDPDVSEAINQCCKIQYLFKQASPRAADFLARIVGTLTLDPMRVKEVITRIRKEHSGEVDIQRITHNNESEDEHGNKRTGISEGHIAIPKFIDRTEEEYVRMSLNEQIQLMAQNLMRLTVGWCIIKYGSEVVIGTEPLKLLEFPARADWPWQLSPRITLAERKLSVYRDYLKTLPAYQTPEPFVCKPTKKTRKSGMD